MRIITHQGVTTADNIMQYTNQGITGPEIMFYWYLTAHCGGRCNTPIDQSLQICVRKLRIRTQWSLERILDIDLNCVFPYIFLIRYVLGLD